MLNKKPSKGLVSKGRVLTGAVEGREEEGKLSERISDSQ